MAGSCINGMTHARRGSISPAVVGCAEVRAALHYFPRDRDVWHLRVITLLADAAARFDSAAAGSGKILMWLVSQPYRLSRGVPEIWSDDFIVSDDGVVYEKDLGPNTGKLASTISTYNPGSTWRKAE
jgi:hypothetical protein